MSLECIAGNRSSRSWKEKVDNQVQNNGGFRLAGFDHKTMYLINKVHVDMNRINTKTQSIATLSIAIVGNLFLFSQIYINYESNKGYISYYCYDHALPISVPCYLTGASLAYWYHAAKVALVITVPYVLFKKKLDQLCAEKVSPNYAKMFKVITYLKQTPNIPDRTLPFYASCIQKGIQCWKKTKSACEKMATATENILQKHVFSHLQFDLEGV